MQTFDHSSNQSAHRLSLIAHYMQVSEQPTCLASGIKSLALVQLITIST